MYNYLYNDSNKNYRNHLYRKNYNSRMSNSHFHLYYSPCRCHYNYLNKNRYNRYNNLFDTKKNEKELRMIFLIMAEHYVTPF